MEMEVVEQIVLTILGIVIVLENVVVILASIRNKSLRENTHYNLVISLSVCDFIVGLNSYCMEIWSRPTTTPVIIRLT